MNARIFEMDPRPGRLWLGFAGGGCAWFLHLLLVWIISEFGCVAGLGRVHAAGLSVVTWLALAASILSLAASGAATLIAWSCRNRLVRVDEAGHPGELFLARAGFITSGLFTGIVAVQSVPILFHLAEC